MNTVHLFLLGLVQLVRDLTLLVGALTLLVWALHQLFNAVGGM